MMKNPGLEFFRSFR